MASYIIVQALLTLPWMTFGFNIILLQHFWAMLRPFSSCLVDGYRALSKQGPSRVLRSTYTSEFCGAICFPRYNIWDTVYANKIWKEPQHLTKRSILRTPQPRRFALASQALKFTLKAAILFERSCGMWFHNGLWSIVLKKKKEKHVP